MKRCLDDSGTVETILNTFPSSSLSLSPTRSRSLSAVSNVTYTPQISNNSIQYPVDSTSLVHNFSAIMPTLTVHEKNPNPNVIPVGSSPVHTTIHTTVPIAHSSLPLNRNKVHSAVVSSTAGQTTTQQFQRLKVEDALSYLDLVKFKFGSQPQVYNDFLDIMKEFKSQSIDTPGVITRVSNLFKGHPELIVGFNTFLPPGYKIEVQSSDSGGYSFQVSVSIPSPSSSTSTLVPSTQSILHSTTISNITSTVTTTASTLLPGTTLSVVNPPIAAKPITLPNSNLAPILTTPLTISSGNTVIPVTNSIAPANVPNNVTSNVPTMAAVALTNSSPPQSFTMNPAAHQAVSHALIQVESGGNVSQPIPQNQPVEFNHAINYVNKIKNRFQGQPDKYKRFLEILHTYQKEQRTLKENQLTSGIAGKTLTEAEVYSQVAKLFENQEDLLTEFGQFLPDATSHQTSFITKNNELSFNSRKPSNVKPGSGVGGGGGGGGGGATFNNTVLNNNTNSSNVPSKFTNNNVSSTTPAAPGLLKRSASISNSHSSIASMQPAVKKHKSPSSLRDLSVTEATKYGTLNDYAFFDRIRKTIQNPEMYRNFLRCLIIYNNEIVNETELLQLTTPFLTSHPELLRWFKEFLGPTETPATTSNRECRESENKRETQHHSFLDQVHNNVVRSENSVDIDYTMCKRIGASYCAVPDEFNSPKCSGRTDLCREVLNDNWVSFPSWSEDSTFVSSRKTQYEEYIYRCEDERFELDVVIETNAATIKVFEGVQKKMSRLTPEDVAKYHLDDNLGGSSQSIHVRAIKRIYGDKAGDIVEGIKKNPTAAIPVVLRRLKSKEEEWREAQKGFNKIWREQNEKFYLKSLDHQGMNFKQNDMKYLRSKSLITEIETLYDDRQNGSDENNAQSGPHLVLPYRDKSVLDDAANLLIHHVKRQTGIHKEDKQKIKSLIRQFIPDLFYHPRQELSDDEREELEEKSTKEVAEGVEEEEDEVEKMEVSSSVTTKVDSGGNGGGEGGGGNGDSSSAMDVSVEDIKVPLYAISCHPDEQYTLFFADNHWYLFLRLHQILCDRLSKMYERANIIAKQESSTKDSRTESAAISLRLKPKPEIEIEEYYTAMLDMVKNVLDNNMDSTTYEDTLREMFGIHAYIAFTLDKVVSHAVRQLQYLVSDRACQQCYEMFTKEKVKGATGGLCSTAHQRVNAEANYQKKAETMRMDSCFKIFIYKLDCKITIECLDTEGDNDEDAQENEKWCNFRENDDSNKDKFASEFNENNDKVES